MKFTLAILSTLVFILFNDGALSQETKELISRGHWPFTKGEMGTPTEMPSLHLIGIGNKRYLALMINQQSIIIHDLITDKAEQYDRELFKREVKITQEFLTKKQEQAFKEKLNKKNQQLIQKYEIKNEVSQFKFGKFPYQTGIDSYQVKINQKFDVMMTNKKLGKKRIGNLKRIQKKQLFWNTFLKESRAYLWVKPPHVDRILVVIVTPVSDFEQTLPSSVSYQFFGADLSRGFEKAKVTNNQ